MCRSRLAFESTLGFEMCVETEPNRVVSQRDPSSLCAVWVELVSLMSLATSGCRPGRHALMTERVWASCMQIVVAQLFVSEEEVGEALKKYSCALTAPTMLVKSAI